MYKVLIFITLVIPLLISGQTYDSYEELGFGHQTLLFMSAIEYLNGDDHKRTGLMKALKEDIGLQCEETTKNETVCTKTYDINETVTLIFFEGATLEYIVMEPIKDYGVILSDLIKKNSIRVNFDSKGVKYYYEQKDIYIKISHHDRKKFIFSTY